MSLTTGVLKLGVKKSTIPNRLFYSYQGRFSAGHLEEGIVIWNEFGDQHVGKFEHGEFIQGHRFDRILACVHLSSLLYCSCTKVICILRTIKEIGSFKDGRLYSGKQKNPLDFAGAPFFRAAFQLVRREEM